MHYKQSRAKKKSSQRFFRSSALRMCAGISCLKGFKMIGSSGAPSRGCASRCYDQSEDQTREGCRCNVHRQGMSVEIDVILMRTHHVQKLLFLCFLPFAIEGWDFMQLSTTQHSAMNLKQEVQVCHDQVHCQCVLKCLFPVFLNSKH